jgi:murein L,D-transpeptidase YafK
VAIGLLIAAVCFIVIGAALTLDWDSIRIEIERTRRLAYATSGARLPGTPNLADFSNRLAAHGSEPGAPVFIRIFKLEFELELWMQRGDRYELFAVYPICRWSGGLGPKLREGDWQAPEGFYTVDTKALNPSSRWHRSFNLGFPNVFDRAHQRTGSYLMVHGGCSSIGCYAMTDAVIDEIWLFMTAALKRGQPRIHVHIFPFRMTEDRLVQRRQSRWAEFWQELKPGYDLFETTRLPPRISVCQGRYAVTPARAGTDHSSAIDDACPSSRGAKT